MNRPLSPLARMLSFICGTALFVVIFVPMWRIDLTAPQYPEGLVLKIHANKLAGDVDVISGLNHYIGMRRLRTEDFVEFTILPYLIGAFALFGIITFLVNRRWFFYTWTALYIAFGVIAMFDFYRWEYNYGHNLDPDAAIIVPGMAYQPPLIGFKQLLNFGAYSFPDIGGYIFLSVGLILVILAYREWKIKPKTIVATTSFLLMLTMQGCSSDPQPISFGKDACHFCKMVISDQRFGAEVITNKNKVYKFDDVHCVISFMKLGDVPSTEIASVYLVDFAEKGKLVKAEESFLLQAEQLRSPMGGNVAAFTVADSMKKFQQEFSGVTVNWKDIIQ